jgi:flagellar hook-associated protein 2
MSDLGLSGLASGVDTSGIIDKLMQIERSKATPITYKQSRVTAQQTALKGIAAKLSALNTAAAALKKSATTWTSTQAVQSSDPTRVGVAKISGAGIGGHSIQVDRLASSAQRGFSIAGVDADGKLTADASLTIGSKTFAFTAGTTVASIVDSINGASDSPVYAALVRNSAGEQRMVLSARTTGESSRFTATGSGFTEDATYATPPPDPVTGASVLNAQYRLDGDPTVRESQTNVLEDSIAGLRLTLNGVTTAPVSVTVAAPDIDRDAVKGKIKAFVDAYNAVVTATRAQLNEKPVVNPANATDASTGSLFGDTGLESMLSGLRNGLRDTLSGLTGVDDLGDLGIGVPAPSGGTSTQDAKDGKFTLDDGKLTDALNSDWTKVAGFLDAFAGKVDGLVKAQTGTSNSLLDGRVTSDDRSLKDLSSQMDALNARLKSQEDRYKAQFAAMELALQNAQNQQSWLAGQLNALNPQ